MSSKDLEDFFEVGQVLDFRCGLHHHVIHIYFKVPANLILEDDIHHPLVGCPRILQAEGHDIVAENSSVNNEESLLLISGIHFYLIVVGKGVEKR